VTWHLGEQGLKDETPQGSFERNLAVALKGREAFRERLAALGGRPLERLLAHVTSTVPYYQEYPPSLQAFETIDRSVMQAKRSLFLSAPYREIGEALSVKTNGTLSTQLRVAFDLAAYFDVNYFAFSRILDTRPELWDALTPEGLAIYLISDDPEQLRLTACMVALRGALMRRLPLGRGDAEDRTTLRQVRERPASILYGKPRALLQIAELDAEEPGGPPIRPRALLTAGENLYDSDRARLVGAFGCDVLNAYTSSEGGLIAVDCPHGPGFHVQTDRLLAEVLTPGGALSPEGSGELVITNFVNWAQAFVRYRQGDQVTVRHGRCGCGFDGPTIVKLSGRDATHLRVRGIGPVETSALEPVLTRPDVKQYEVRQEEGGTLAVRWIPAGRADEEAVARALDGGLRAVVGDAFTLSRVDTITEPGGKLRRFVGP
jgi:phenylacetate-CoA ligase